MAFLHQLEVAHLDLKPENILVSGLGEVKIIDYGRSVVARERKSLRAKGLIGTTGFIAPEIQRGKEYLVFPADVYSVGCVIGEMLEVVGRGARKRSRVEGLVKALNTGYILG